MRRSDEIAQGEAVEGEARMGSVESLPQYRSSSSGKVPSGSSVEVTARALISEMQLNIDRVRASVRSSLSEYEEPQIHIDTGIVNAFDQLYGKLQKHLEKNTAWRPKPSPQQWLKQEVLKHTAHKYLLVVEARLNDILRDKRVKGVPDWEDIKQTIVCRLAVSLSEDARWRPTKWNKLADYLKTAARNGRKDSARKDRNGQTARKQHLEAETRRRREIEVSDQELSADEVYNLTREAVLLLPETLRTIAALVEDKATSRQMGTALGCAPSTARKYRSAAKKQLRAILKTLLEARG